MTNIKISNNYVEIKGHSGYENIGKDIVCASISTLAFATINYLNLLDIDLEIIDEKAYLFFKCKKENNITKKIFNGLKLMLKDLESQFPSNIKIKEINK